MTERTSCPYCQNPLGNESVLAEVCTLTYSILSVYKNQYYRGRCVLSLREHYEELHEIDLVTYRGFMEEVRKTCALISRLFNPDKIQIALYGDVVRHMHLHIVPKYHDSPTWGHPFMLNPNCDSDESWKHVVELIQHALEKTSIAGASDTLETAFPPA